MFWFCKEKIEVDHPGLGALRIKTINFDMFSIYMYSGTPPYDHPVYKTTSLLRPYSFKPNVKTIESFYYFDDPVNATTSLLRPGFYGPTVVALTGFHCTTTNAALNVNYWNMQVHNSPEAPAYT